MQEVEIFDSSFHSKMYQWKMPKSDLFYPIVELGNSCIGGTYCDSDKLRFELFFREVYKNFVLSKKLILDISNIKNENSLINLLEETESNYLDEIIVVGASKKFNFSHNKITFCDSREQGIMKILEIDRKKRFDGGKSFDPTSNQYQITILPYDFPEMKTIHLSMFTHDEFSKKIGYVIIKGDIGEGSRDSDDIQILNRKINYFDKLYSTDLLILDFTNLNYSWGNDLSLYPNRFKYVNLSEEEYRSLFLVLTEDQILNGYSYLLNENEDRIYPSFEIAMDEIKFKIQSGKTNN